VIPAISPPHGRPEKNGDGRPHLPTLREMNISPDQAKDVELQAWVTEIRLRAERRTGELLRGMQKHRGGNPNLSNRDDGLLTLKRLGISRDQSSEWQALAANGVPFLKADMRGSE
jgi:hypothetical protein